MSIVPPAASASLAAALTADAGTATPGRLQGHERTLGPIKLADLPPGLTSLDRSISVPARVMKVDSAGFLTLRTSHGIVSGQPSFDVGAGTQLRLVLAAGSPPTTAIAHSQTSVIQPSIGGPPQAALPSGPSAPALPLLAPGATIVARPVATTQTTPSSPVIPSTAPQSSTATTPGAASGAAPGTPSGSALTGLLAAQEIGARPTTATAPAPQTPTAQQPRPPAFQVVSLSSPDSDIPPQPQGTIRATVTTLTHDGRPLITTQSGQTFMLDVRGRPAIGTILTLQPTGASLGAVGQPGSGLISNPAHQPDWRGLESVYSALASASQARLASLTGILPRNAGDLGPAILFLLAALKVNAPRTWLGEAPRRALEDLGRRDLFDVFSREFTAAAKRFGEPPIGDWRSISLPFWTGEGIERLQIALRRDPESDDRRGDQVAKRFLVDLTLSQLGALQIDGFSHLRRLDIMVRSEEDLEQSLQDSLTQRYTEVMGALGMVGRLGFSIGRETWTLIDPDAHQALYAV